MFISVAVLHSAELRSDPNDSAEVNPEDIAFVQVTIARIVDFFDFSSNYADVSSNLYLRAAERGHSGAQATIGDRYSIGFGVEYDPEQAVRWWEKAGERNNLHALEMLVEHYRKTDDHIAQINWTRLAAEAGVLRGQIMLGWYYQHGVGVERDPYQAIKWYTLAVERGDPLAHTNLAAIYEGREDGDPQDLAKAYELHIKAIELGSGDGLRHLTNLIRNEQGNRHDRSQGFAAIVNEAEKGVPLAQFYAGKLFLEGKGTEKNAEEAVRWFIESANSGNVYAQNELASCYEKGTGVSQDFELALYWRTAAANQGDAYAQYLVANAYTFGQGVVVDDELALLWLRSAAEQDLYLAQYTLGYRYFDGKGVEQDLDLARHWFRLAARQGDGLSIDMLVRTYLEYPASSDDIADGLMWIHISAMESEESRARLGLLTAAEQDPTKRYSLMYGAARAAVWENAFRANGGEFLPRRARNRRPER